MSQLDYWFCPTCYAARGSRSSALKYEGEIGICTGCGTNAVRHKCAHASSTAQPAWLPILEAAVGAVCPECGAIIRVSQRVKALPNAPDNLKSAADIAIGAALAVGVGMLIGAVLDAIRRAGKR
jgi:predicted RNA-binding Zn-ribbon protein involved in translation (DUF1610 family)